MPKCCARNLRDRDAAGAAGMISSTAEADAGCPSIVQGHGWRECSMNTIVTAEQMVPCANTKQVIVLPHSVFVLNYYAPPLTLASSLSKLKDTKGFVREMPESMSRAEEEVQWHVASVQDLVNHIVGASEEEAADAWIPMWKQQVKGLNEHLASVVAAMCSSESLAERVFVDGLEELNKCLSGPGAAEKVGIRVYHRRDLRVT